MGMYTGLRFKAVIKERYCKAIKEMIEEGYDWDQVVAYYPEFDFAKDYSTYSRADFIPCGGLAYMPDSWEDEEGRKEFLRNFDEESKIWTFQCSLKNYDNTIGKFLDEVASIIVEEVIHIEKHYEEDRYGRIYELVDGKFIENESKNIDYEPWKDEEENYYW